MKRHANGVAIAWRSPNASSAALDRGGRRPLVRVEHLALDDAEVELDLVEPGGVDRGVDDPDRRPPLAQTGLGPGAAMTAAVVDDPEHAPGAGVRLRGHDLLDESVERLDPGRPFTASEDLRPPDVPGREVGERPGPLVFVLDPARPTGSGWRSGVDPGAGLDARLLVGADDVLVRAQWLAPETTGIQVEDRAGQASKDRAGRSSSDSATAASPIPRRAARRSTARSRAPSSLGLGKLRVGHRTRAAPGGRGRSGRRSR